MQTIYLLTFKCISCHYFRFSCKVERSVYVGFIVKEDGLILLHLEKGELNQPISLSAEDSNDLL